MLYELAYAQCTNLNTLLSEYLYFYIDIDVLYICSYFIFNFIILWFTSLVLSGSFILSYPKMYNEQYASDYS